MGTAAMLIPLIISMIGQGVGMAGSAKANGRIDKFIANRSDDIQSTFDKEYNTNIFDTDQGKSLVQLLRNQFDQASKKVTGNNIVSGGSVESKVGGISKLKEGFDNALLQTAAQGGQRKDMLTMRKDDRMDGIASTMLQNLIGKSQNWTNFGSNVSDAASGMAYAGMGGGQSPWGKGGFGSGEFM